MEACWGSEKELGGAPSAEIPGVYGRGSKVQNQRRLGKEVVAGGGGSELEGL